MSTGLWIGISSGAVVIIALIVLLIILATRSRHTPHHTTTHTTHTPTATPTGVPVFPLGGTTHTTTHAAPHHGTNWAKIILIALLVLLVLALLGGGGFYLQKSASDARKDAHALATQVALGASSVKTQPQGSGTGSNGSTGSSTTAPLPNAPTDFKGWLTMVQQNIVGYGAVTSSLDSYADNYGAIVVRFDVAWPVPSGWIAHQGNNKPDSYGGAVLNPGVTYSIYPPCAWRSQLGVGGC